MNDNIEEITKNKPHYVLNAFCLECFSKWKSVVVEDTPVFLLECYNCGAQNSFAATSPWE